MASTVSVSIVFTDLVDSTLIASRLGPEAAEAFRRSYFDLLRQAVTAHEGTEVKSTGDGLMAAYGSVSAALESSVAIQQALERHNRTAAEPLSVRIGVSHGEAECTEDDYYGPPVVEAARLCADADGGQILTTELVRMLVGKRGGHEFHPLGPRQFKGLPDPVAVCALAWAPLAGPSLQARLDQAPAVAFFGRSGHLENLGAKLKEAGSGSLRVALVSGEAGVGKTRLATEVARRAHEEGDIVLYGRCEEELGVAYQPWIEALRHLVAHGTDALLNAHVARHGGELGRLVPQLEARVPGLPAPTQSDPEAERYLLFGAVVGILARASVDARVVLVLDDLHWADKPSLLLLKHLVSSSTGARMLVVGTYRDTDLSTSHPLLGVLADLHREPGVERIILGGLEDFELLGMLETLTGHALDEAGINLAHALSRETDGNPFFVLEILRHLAESDAVYQQDDGRWVLRGDLAQLGVPQSIREVVGRRIERLGDRAVRILGMGAVIGREFDLDLLTAITDVSEDDLVDLLDEVTSAGIVSEVSGSPGRYTFTHALIEHALYEELSAARRQRAHLRTAEALENLGGERAGRVGELAHHWAQATRPTDTAKALEYARRAAEQALAQLGPDEAVRWYGKALDLLAQQSEPDPADRAELLVGLGSAQRQAGDAAYRETLLDAARLCMRLGDTGLLVRAALANSRGQISAVGELDTERVEVLRAALDAVGPADTTQRARLLALLAAELSIPSDDQEVRPLVHEALAMARRIGEPATLSYVLHLSNGALVVPDTLAERMANTAENVALSEQLGDPVARWAAAFDRVITIMEAGDIEEVDRQLAVVQSSADETSDPGMQYFAATLRAARLLSAGRLEEAERVADEILDIGIRSGQPDTLALYGAVLLSLRRDQGRLDEMVDMVIEAQAAYPALTIIRPNLALVYTELDRTDDAVAILADAASDHFAGVLYNSGGWLSSLCCYSEVCAVLGAVGPATDLAALITPYADHVVCAGQFSSGSARRYLGLLATTVGDFDAAARHFDAALTVNERIGAPIWAARTRVDWARSLLSRNGPDDPRQARTLADAARRTAAERGCRRLEHDATELLAHLDGRAAGA